MVYRRVTICVLAIWYVTAQFVAAHRRSVDSPATAYEECMLIPWQICHGFPLARWTRFASGTCDVPLRH